MEDDKFITIPDNWVVIKLEKNDKSPLIKTIYKVFASWTEGYLDNDSWRINSGIESVDEDSETIYFKGYSGSCYACRKSKYGMGGKHSSDVLNRIITEASESKATLTILPEDTNWRRVVDSGRDNDASYGEEGE